MISVKEKIKKSRGELKKLLGVSNDFALPKIEKVVINVGTGSSKDKNRAEVVSDRLAKITGQKPSSRLAKKSIASFKLREGEPIGQAVTLRGERMYDFLDRLINIAFPRTRDFRGIDVKGIDNIGNITIGIKEHVVFPETADEDLKDVFGMSITIVTTAKDRKSAESFIRGVGLPFKKEKATK